MTATYICHYDSEEDNAWVSAGAAPGSGVAVVWAVAALESVRRILSTCTCVYRARARIHPLPSSDAATFAWSYRLRFSPTSALQAAHQRWRRVRVQPYVNALHMTTAKATDDSRDKFGARAFTRRIGRLRVSLWRLGSGRKYRVHPA